MATQEEMIAGVREHAYWNYSKDGWDYVVECWSDNEIAEEIVNCRTVKGAIRKMRAVINPLHEYRKDVVASADW